MKNLLLLTLTLIAFGFANAGIDEKEGLFNVSGKVIDKNTNEPIIGAKVILAEFNKVVYTDFEGNYTFENIKSGDYSINVSYISYEDVENMKVSTKLKSNEIQLIGK